jgi:hypothetical protein
MSWFFEREVDCPSFLNSEQILGDHTSLLSRAEDLGLLNDGVRVLDKTVSVAARACGDSLCYDGVAPFANLIKLRFRGNFGRFRCSFAERHTLFSSEFAELDSNFWRLFANLTFSVQCSARSAWVQVQDIGNTIGSRHR